MVAHAERVTNNRDQRVAVAEGYHIHGDVEISEDGLCCEFCLSDMIYKKSDDLGGRPLYRDKSYSRYRNFEIFSPFLEIESG